MPAVGASGHHHKPRLLAGAACTVLCLASVCLAAEPPLAAASPLADSASLFAVIVKVFGSLLVVVGLMLVLLYAIKRTGLGSARGRAGSAIAVLETRMVAPKKYIAIVEVAGHCLALGITDHTISLLSDLGAEAKDLLKTPPSSGKPGPAFAGLLHKSTRSWQEATNRGRADQTNPTTNDTSESP